MNDIVKPTAEEIIDEDGLECVHREADDSWRHGSYITQVVYRSSDDTYWQASYRKSGDGEYNGLCEDEADIVQCYPVEKTIIVYQTEPVKKD